MRIPNGLWLDQFAERIARDIDERVIAGASSPNGVLSLERLFGFGWRVDLVDAKDVKVGDLYRVNVPNDVSTEPGSPCHGKSIWVDQVRSELNGKVVEVASEVMGHPPYVVIRPDEDGVARSPYVEWLELVGEARRGDRARVVVADCAYEPIKGCVVEVGDVIEVGGDRLATVTIPVQLGDAIPNGAPGARVKLFIRRLQVVVYTEPLTPLSGAAVPVLCPNVPPTISPPAVEDSACPFRDGQAVRMRSLANYLSGSVLIVQSARAFKTRSGGRAEGLADEKYFNTAEGRTVAWNLAEPVVDFRPGDRVRVKDDCPLDYLRGMVFVLDRRQTIPRGVTWEFPGLTFKHPAKTLLCLREGLLEHVGVDASPSVIPPEMVNERAPLVPLVDPETIRELEAEIASLKEVLAAARREAEHFKKAAQDGFIDRRDLILKFDLANDTVRLLGTELEERKQKDAQIERDMKMLDDAVARSDRFIPVPQHAYGPSPLAVLRSIGRIASRAGMGALRAASSAGGWAQRSFWDSVRETRWQNAFYALLGSVVVGCFLTAIIWIDPNDAMTRAQMQAVPPAANPFDPSARSYWMRTQAAPPKPRRWL